MQRNVTIGIVGVVVVSALVVGIGATALGSPAASVRPSQAAEVPTATPAGETPAAPTATTEPTASPSPTAAPTPTPVPTPVTVPAPLTGRPVSPAVAKRHPIAVMIDDLGAARPQSGLSSASVVWQAPAEGGIPRYMAIFQDSLPKDIGPVRSSRYYYIAWAAEWRAVYAHAGGSPQAKATLAAKGRGQYVYNIDEFRYSGTFHRVTFRAAPHNLYTTGTALRAAGKHQGSKDKTYTAAWTFAPDAPLEARPTGGTITVKYPYNTIGYAYDRKTNTYLRSVTGEKKETDKGTGVRIAPKNVVVMRMRFGPLNDGHPGAPRLEATVVGSGTAWVFTNGKTIKGTWKKTAITKPTRFYDKNGKQIPLTIGQTFVQVIPGNYPFSYKAGTPPPPTTATPSGSPSPS